MSVRRAVFAVGVVTAVVLGMCKIEEPDVGWLLRSGEWVVANGRVPTETLFSWTAHGKWMLHEWLTAVVVWGAFRVGKWWGVGVLQAVIFAVTMVSIAVGGGRVGGRVGGGLRGEVLVPLAVLTVVLRETVSPRAQWFTNCLLAVSLAVFLPRAQREDPGPWWRDSLGWVLPLGLVWTQVHGGAPHLVVVMAAVLIARPSWRSFTAVVMAAVLTLAGPYGWRVHEHYLSARAMVTELREWWPLSRALAVGWLPGYVTVGLAMGGFASVWMRARGGEKVRAEVVLLTVFSVMAVRHLRFVAELGVVSTVSLVAGVSWLIARENKGDELGRREALAVVCAVVLVLFGVARDGRRWGVGWSDKFDGGLAEVLAERSLRGPMFNSYNLGGWLVWEVRSRPVFIDGRAFTAYGPERVAEMISLVREPERTLGVLDRWRANLAVITRSGRGEAVARAVAQNPRWRLVYLSRQSAVFQRKDLFR